MGKVSELDVVEFMELFAKTKEVIDEEIKKDDPAVDMVEFSKGYIQGMTGAYSPDMTNTTLKSINLNPLTATVEKIDKALEDAKNNEDLLVAYGQDMYLKNMLYKRNFDYINLLPAWNLSIRCVGSSAKDTKGSQYKQDRKKIRDFLAKFDYRKEFEKAFFNMLNAERYPCIFRTDMDDENYVLQDFPYLYTKITGRSTWGLYYDIDMNYFTQPSVDIDLYPDILKKKYNELFTSKSTEYLPSASYDARTGKFAMWTQTSYEDGFWCFKFKNDIIANIPYFSAMLSDLVLIPVYRKLQLSQSVSAARKIIASAWPLLKEQKSGNVSDMLAIKPETMGKIMGAFAKGLEDAFKIINLPSEDIQQFEFENTDKGSYSDFLKVTSSLLGGGNVLFNVSKNTVAETNLSVNIDEMLATSIYPQFEKFLEYQISLIVSPSHKYKVKLSGTNSYLNRKHRFDTAFDAASKGVVSINKIANALDMDMFELEDELEMTQGMDFTKKLMPMLNMYTQSKNETDKGRPQKPDTELTDSGAESRQVGSNIEKGGKI